MTTRASVLVVLTSLLLAPLSLTAPAAHAAWTTQQTVDGARLLICKQPRGDGRIRVKARLDNRRADHTHLAGVSRTRGAQTTRIDFRTAAGRLSPTKSLVWRRGDTLVAGMGEPSGEGAGGDFVLRDVTRC